MGGAIILRIEYRTKQFFWLIVSPFVTIWGISRNRSQKSQIGLYLFWGQEDSFVLMTAVAFSAPPMQLPAWQVL